MQMGNALGDPRENSYRLNRHLNILLLCNWIGHPLGGTANDRMESLVVGNIWFVQELKPRSSRARDGDCRKQT